MKRYLIFLFIQLLFLQFIFAQTTVSEIRGLWIVRHNMKSAKTIDAFLEFADKNAFTDLFVQVRGRGDAYYNSHFEPLAEGLAPDFDPLAYLMRQSRNYKFRIHAWINVFYLWSSETPPLSTTHLFYQKPEWIIFPAHYDPAQPDTNMTAMRNEEGLYLSPLLAEVQQHILNVVNDILDQYRVDGIHLDYIRFPGYGYDFDQTNRQRFKEKYVLDPLDFKKDPAQFVQNFGPTGYDIFFSRWGQFLRDGLSGFVEKLSLDVREKYPTVILSAAVKPELSKAHWRYYQDWDRWLNAGWLDWAVPMNYTKDNRLFLQRIEAMSETVNLQKTLMGIALYNQSPAAAMEKVRLLHQLEEKQVKLRGIVLFSYDQISWDKKLQRLYRQIFLQRRSKP